MSDFRADLYRRYVKNFKKEQAQVLTGTALEAYWEWCSYRFLPLLAGVQPDDPVLELGCGSGYMLSFLAQSGFSNVQGIDISEDQIGAASGRGLDAEVADAFDYLDSASDKFKAILTLDFIEHFSKDELLRLAPSVLRSLTEGGIWIIQTPNGQGLFPHQVIYGDITHLCILTPSSLQQVLSSCGFEGFEFYETGPVPKDLRGRVRVALWELLKKSANLMRKIETGKTQDLWTENMICLCRKPAGTP